MPRSALLFGLLLVVFAARVPCQQNLAEQYLLSAANQERSAHGLPALRLDANLTQAARQHAHRMAAHHGISHQFPGERELSERGYAAGAQFSRITENVAEAPSPLILQTAWMRSAGHRENLLDPGVDVVGIAVVVRARQLYAVEDFARATPRLSLAEQEIATALLLDQVGVTLLPDNSDARSACAAASLPRGSTQPLYVLRYTAMNLDALPQELTRRLATGDVRVAAVGACGNAGAGPFTVYRLAVLLYP